jgi:hypothetical protein
MKFLVQNYSCLQNPWLGGYCPQIPVLCPQLNLLNPLQTKFLGTPLTTGIKFGTDSHFILFKKIPIDWLCIDSRYAPVNLSLACEVLYVIMLF